MWILQMLVRWTTTTLSFHSIFSYEVRVIYCKCVTDILSSIRRSNFENKCASTSHCSIRCSRLSNVIYYFRNKYLQTDGQTRIFIFSWTHKETPNRKRKSKLLIDIVNLGINHGELSEWLNIQNSFLPFPLSNICCGKCHLEAFKLKAISNQICYDRNI